MRKGHGDGTTKSRVTATVAHEDGTASCRVHVPVGHPAETFHEADGTALEMDHELEFIAGLGITNPRAVDPVTREDRGGRKPARSIRDEPRGARRNLGDRGALEAFDRPFRDVEAMNRHLLAAWRRLVNDGDTIICLDKVAHPDAFRDRRLTADLHVCPGERILVRGNHDTNCRALENAGFTVQHRYALHAADSLLARSHEPLQRVPVGTVNAHAHLHEGIEPTRTQRLRTLAQVQLDLELVQPAEVPVYQSIAARAAEMHDRGFASAPSRGPSVSTTIPSTRLCAGFRSR